MSAWRHPAHTVRHLFPNCTVVWQQWSNDWGSFGADSEHFRVSCTHQRWHQRSRSVPEQFRGSFRATSQRSFNEETEQHLPPSGNQSTMKQERGSHPWRHHHLPPAKESAKNPQTTHRHPHPPPVHPQSTPRQESCENVKASKSIETSIQTWRLFNVKVTSFPTPIYKLAPNSN